ncbi:2'-5' RNA ligase family protein [Frankia sp. AgPm24]|uniref:2'-5' RNA ligase family protein n=1 Tax=Frankia sp. AgPm24 TaxID=631128 RepID=UPI00200FC376|nr:2'-5' RNA ligase family protein [Frankia sp. AgPm24]MCK9921053.1 2'-5' RNA ligase family protein [Frankia sp. AgPm24]
MLQGSGPGSQRPERDRPEPGTVGCQSSGSQILDVVFLPPPSLAERVVRESRALAAQMRHAGNPSHFVLAGSAPGGGTGVCAPHVSLFMLTADPADLPAVLRALRAVAAASAPVPAVGRAYTHNPHGAPELHFAGSPAWTALQRRVVAAFEPLRRGRQRTVDPAGVPLATVLADDNAATSARRRQLLTYGYDEITDDLDDRFRPHITLAWPERDSPAIPLDSLQPATDVQATFDHLAVHSMSAWGTCTVSHGTARLTGPR